MKGECPPGFNGAMPLRSGKSPVSDQRTLFRLAIHAFKESTVGLRGGSVSLSQKALAPVPRLTIRVMPQPNPFIGPITSHAKEAPHE